MKSVIMLLLVTLLSLCGCSRDDSPVNIPKPVPEAPDPSIVVANCAVLQAAVEQFAAENDGVYPDDVDIDTSLAGNTVLDLLPPGGFENPFTKAKEAPVNGAADSPGEVGYIAVAEGEWNVGYVVTGYGSDALVAEMSNLGSPEEAKVIANCFIVKQAAEKMFDDNHEYPHEIDYRYWWHLHLPHSLVNPYTGLAEYPAGRTACSLGQIGYVAILQNDLPIGYVITGYGSSSIIFTLSNLGYSREEAIIASGCRTLQRSVEEYAEANDGLYPCTAVCPPGVMYETTQIIGWNVGYKILGSAGGSKCIEIATSSQEARVRLNCILLKQAVEAFAAQSGGVCPEDVDSDRTPGGQTVVDLLPRGYMHGNPYNGMREVPQNHSATFPGEIGYAAVPEYRPGGERNVGPGYVITGFVNDVRVVAVTNLAVSPGEAIVMSHCRTVQLAVEEFADHNGGIYPSDVDADEDPRGKTVTGFLPREVLLLNPVTCCATEPVNGGAANPGEIGYTPCVQGGVNRGYVITGVGVEAGTTIMEIYRDPLGGL